MQYSYIASPSQARPVSDPAVHSHSQHFPVKNPIHNVSVSPRLAPSLGPLHRHHHCLRLARVHVTQRTASYPQNDQQPRQLRVLGRIRQVLLPNNLPALFKPDNIESCIIHSSASPPYHQHGFNLGRGYPLERVNLHRRVKTFLASSNSRPRLSFSPVQHRSTHSPSGPFASRAFQREQHRASVSNIVDGRGTSTWHKVVPTSEREMKTGVVQ